MKALDGVIGGRREGRIGIWVDTPTGEAKIAALGVRISRWVTTHGTALNVSPEGKDVLPPKDQTYGSIEGLIHHFEMIMTNRGFEPPKGEVYGCTETANGELGYFQHAWKVYGRENEPCPTCPGGKACDGVKRITQAGRSTFYCPRVQR